MIRLLVSLTPTSLSVDCCQLWPIFAVLPSLGWDFWKDDRPCDTWSKSLRQRLLGVAPVRCLLVFIWVFGFIIESDALRGGSVDGRAEGTVSWEENYWRLIWCSPAGGSVWPCSGSRQNVQSASLTSIAQPLFINKPDQEEKSKQGREVLEKGMLLLF